MLVAPAIKKDDEQLKKNNSGNEIAFAIFFHGFKKIKL